MMKVPHPLLFLFYEENNIVTFKSNLTNHHQSGDLMDGWT